MDRRRQISTILLTAIITVIAVIFVLKIVPFKIGDQVLIDYQEYEKLQGLNRRFEKVLSLERTIKEEFYKDTAEIDFETGMVRGLFEALGDKYSVYFDKDEFSQFKLELQGSFSGVGINIEPMVDGQIRVLSIIEDTPASASGILAGDRIFSVDDKPITEDESHNAAVGRIKGPEGTEVVLGVYRYNSQTEEDEELNFTMKRAKIPLPLVESEMLGEGIGYLRILGFDEGVHKKFLEAKKSLEDSGMEALVLDLRSNPGGSLNEAIKIADEILGEQIIVSTQGPSFPKKVYESDAKKSLDIPFVVLMDNYSASASEILVGAIQDGEVAPVFGSHSFGKGLVQDVISLGDGSGFKLTTNYYLTPKGRLITPDEPLLPDVSEEEILEKGFESTFDEFGRYIDDGVLDYAVDYLNNIID
ncbi:MAG TPA: S41 family peptidase [Clostridia bacterium]|nr:S41 family peptidase [Clostridia bacterium]